MKPITFLLNSLSRSVNRAAIRAGNTSATPVLLDEYVAGMPCAQNAIDALPGWNTAFPDNVGVVAGLAHLHHDPRILWALEQFGDLSGRRVLELGPLEASHTYMIEKHGPAVLHAVEANKLSFLRCLVVKELLDLKIAKFFLGDFTPWLEQTAEPYDLIVASGVLYHQNDPLGLLELLADKTNSLFLWTHYVSDEAMPEGDPRRSVFVGPVKHVTRRDVTVRLYPRSYWLAWKDKAFCGGMHDLHYWLDREDLLAFLSAIGFDDIRISVDQPDHPNGPSFAVFARRTTAKAAAPDASA